MGANRRTTARWTMALPRRPATALVLGLLRFYRGAISPWLPKACRFEAWRLAGAAPHWTLQPVLRGWLRPGSLKADGPRDDMDCRRVAGETGVKADRPEEQWAD
jgi:hypothetical protein